MKIVVIGGTGLIGSQVVPLLSADGHEVVAAAPESGVNTVTREGLAEAFAGAHTVVDLSNLMSFDDREVLEFFETSTRNQLAAEAVAAVEHHVALSVVGTQELSESGYFRAKIAQENLISTSPIPYTIVHATQFFEFLGTIAALQTDGNTVRVPDVLLQPMASADVAAAVARIAASEPVNGTVEIGGPEAFALAELIGRVLRADGDDRPVVTDPDATYFGAHVGQRTLVPGPDASLSTTRYDDWSIRVA